jgi:hypothetical protein
MDWILDISSCQRERAFSEITKDKIFLSGYLSYPKHVQLDTGEIFTSRNSIFSDGKENTITKFQIVLERSEIYSVGKIILLPHVEYSHDFSSEEGMIYINFPLKNEMYENLVASLNAFEEIKKITLHIDGGDNFSALDYGLDSQKWHNTDKHKELSVIAVTVHSSSKKFTYEADFSGDIENKNYFMKIGNMILVMLVLIALLSLVNILK